MAKENTTAPTEGKASATNIKVDVAEFVRTRDAVITAWTRLHGALQHAIQAYIDHSNAVLAGDQVLDSNALQALLSAAAQPVPVAVPALRPEDAPTDKKLKKEKKERDPNAPKRPLTAYLLYVSEIRDQVAKDLGPDQSRQAHAFEATKRWNVLPADQQQVYKDRYKHNWDDYVVVRDKYVAEKGLSLEDDDADDEHPGVPAAASPSKAKAPRVKKPKAAPAAKATPSAAIVTPSTDLDDSSVVSSSSDSETEEVVKTTKKTAAPATPAEGKRKPGRPVGSKTKSKAKADAAPGAIDASAAALASSPPHTNKKSKATFSTVNGASTAAAAAPSSPTKKRKTVAAADDSAPAKKAKKVADTAESDGAKKDKKKKRKSTAATEAA